MKHIYLTSTQRPNGLFNVTTASNYKLIIISSAVETLLLIAIYSKKQYNCPLIKSNINNKLTNISGICNTELSTAESTTSSELGVMAQRLHPVPDISSFPDHPFCINITVQIWIGIIYATDKSIANASLRWQKRGKVVYYCIKRMWQAKFTLVEAGKA